MVKGDKTGMARIAIQGKHLLLMQHTESNRTVKTGLKTLKLTEPMRQHHHHHTSSPLAPQAYDGHCRDTELRDQPSGRSAAEPKQGFSKKDNQSVTKETAVKLRFSV